MVKVGQIKSIVIEYKDGTVETLDEISVVKMEVVHSGANKGEHFPISTFTVNFADVDDFNTYMTWRSAEYAKEIELRNYINTVGK